MKHYTEAEAKKLLKQHVRANFESQKAAGAFYGVTRAHMSNCMNVNVESYPPNEAMLNSIGLTKESIIVKIRR